MVGREGETATFATVSRSKASSRYGYPVGAQLVSELLADVPQAGLLTLRFECWEALWEKERSETRRLLRLECGRPVRPFAPSRARVEAGEFEPRCTIVIDAVRRAHRPQARQKIVEEVLPAVRTWLQSHPARAGQEPVHAITFHWSETEDEIVETGLQD